MHFPLLHMTGAGDAVGMTVGGAAVGGATVARGVSPGKGGVIDEESAFGGGINGSGRKKN